MTLITSPWIACPFLLKNLANGKTERPEPGASPSQHARTMKLQVMAAFAPSPSWSFYLGCSLALHCVSRARHCSPGSGAGSVNKCRQLPCIVLNYWRYCHHCHCAAGVHGAEDKSHVGSLLQDSGGLYTAAGGLAREPQSGWRSREFPHQKKEAGLNLSTSGLCRKVFRFGVLDMEPEVLNTVFKSCPNDSIQGTSSRTNW